MKNRRLNVTDFAVFLFAEIDDAKLPITLHNPMFKWGDPEKAPEWYGAVMYNTDGTGEYLGAAPGGETISTIRGCAHVITDRYRELYGQVPESFTLESMWFSEQTDIEHTHDIWGYPQIKGNRQLHGFQENGTYWLYGRIYDIVAFIKSL